MRRSIFGRGIVVAVILGGIFCGSRNAYAENFSSQSYQVLAPAITSGGGYANSSSFSVLGVISEFVHTTANSLAFISNPGFAAYPFVSTPVVSATGGDTTATLSWTAATGVLGYSVSGYSVGKSSTASGPYTFTAVGNVFSYSASGLTNDSTYYFIVRVLDPQGITIATSSEVSATPTAPYSPPPTPPPPPVNNGGSSGGSVGSVIPVTTSSNATVNFSGRAYPSSTITLLQDARVEASTVADANAAFQISLTNVSAGNYIYSVYSEDSSGNRSGLLSFPVSVTAGTVTNIGGIFISPTIDVDKSEVKKGDNIAIFGQSSPRSSVTITVNSSVELFLQARSDVAGVYLYNLDTTPLDLGSHAAKSKAATSTEISDFGQTVGFTVGTQNVKKGATTKCSLIGDLNCDGKVNLIDFSIMAYWYQRTLSGKGFNADLNHDNKVNLTDFSILASHWTG